MITSSSSLGAGGGGATCDGAAKDRILVSRIKKFLELSRLDFILTFSPIKNVGACCWELLTDVKKVCTPSVTAFETYILAKL
eukprot:1248916-Amphidinium_carterae.1